jgi:hypothetical protein
MAHSSDSQSAESTQGDPSSPLMHWPLLLPEPTAQRSELQLASVTQYEPSSPSVQLPLP